jgi:hypothetical protein
MAQMWHAFYFNSFDRSAAPSRSAMIEADDEDQAGRLAMAQMGPSMRVEIAQPIWHGARTPSSTIRRPGPPPFAAPTARSAAIPARDA